MLDQKFNTINDLRGSARSAGGWRRGRGAKFNDPRNARAENLLYTLSAEIKTLTDDQFAEIEPYVDCPAWRSSVSQVCREVGFKNVDTVPAFVARLVEILQSAAA
jgi:hypothetical protein